MTERTQVAAAPDYERLVREAWEAWRIDAPSGCVFIGVNGEFHVSWQAAWEYTEDLKREIAEIEEEIAVCHEYIDGRERFIAAGYTGYDNARRDLDVFKRILASRKAIREAKARGLR